MCPTPNPTLETENKATGVSCAGATLDVRNVWTLLFSNYNQDFPT